MYRAVRLEQYKLKLEDIQYEMERYKIARILGIPYRRKRIVAKLCRSIPCNNGKVVPYSKFMTLYNEYEKAEKELAALPRLNTDTIMIQEECFCGSKCMF